MRISYIRHHRAVGAVEYRNKRHSKPSCPHTFAPHSELAYTPPTMSARTTSAPRARRLLAERRHAVRVEAMGGVGGAVGLRYEASE